MASGLPNRSADGFSESGGHTPTFERAFDALVEHQYPRLCTFALQLLRSPDAAEDAVQEVLYKAWSRRILEDVRDPVPYLYQAVRNQCLMVLRRERRRHTIQIDTAQLVRPASFEDSELLDLQDAIARAIDTLPERTRLVFTMHRQQDLTYADIARVLGISVKTVETQMTRALKSLRRQLDRFLCLGTVAVSVTEWWLHLVR